MKNLKGMEIDNVGLKYHLLEIILQQQSIPLQEKQLKAQSIHQLLKKLSLKKDKKALKKILNMMSHKKLRIFVHNFNPATHPLRIVL